MTDDLDGVWRDDRLIEAAARGDVSEALDADPDTAGPLLALSALADARPLPRLDVDAAAVLDRGRSRRYAVRSLAVAVTVVATMSTSGVAAVVTGDPFRPAKAVWNEIQDHTVGRADADGRRPHSGAAVAEPAPAAVHERAAADGPLTGADGTDQAVRARQPVEGERDHGGSASATGRAADASGGRAGDGSTAEQAGERSSEYGPEPGPQSQPAESQPAESQPAESQPAESQQAESQQAESQQAESQQAESQPSGAQSSESPEESEPREDGDRQDPSTGAEPDDDPPPSTDPGSGDDPRDPGGDTGDTGDTGDEGLIVPLVRGDAERERQEDDRTAAEDDRRATEDDRTATEDDRTATEDDRTAADDRDRRDRLDAPRDGREDLRRSPTLLDGVEGEAGSAGDTR